MKKSILGILLVLMAVLPGTAAANYSILLKSGSEMVVEEYWQGNGTVSFYYRGGLVELPSGVIQDIRETHESTPEIVALAETAPARVERSQPTAKAQEKAEAKQGEAAAEAEEKMPDDPFISEFNEIKETYKDRRKMSREEIIDLDKKMTEFKNKVIQSRLSGFYRDQLITLFAMGDELQKELDIRQ